MASFTTETKIEAPVEEVWNALADIGNIYRWNRGVVDSHLTSDEAAGIGAARYCDLGGNNYLDEQVVEWEHGERLTMRIVGTNLPFKTVDIRFRLRPNPDTDRGGTAVSVSPVYELKYGPMGKILDAVYVRGTYLKGMKALLRGLKDYVESGGETARDGTHTRNP
jgi:uncharacterized protein YndB with AHSA1/START domain